MKINKNGMITRIISIALAVLSFVGMAFAFGGVKGGGESQSFKFGEWIDSIGSGLKYEVDGIGWWNASRIFLIISFVVVAVLAIIAIVQFFYNHKILSLVMKFGGIVGIVTGVVFVATLIGGNIALGNEYMSYFPHVGAIVIALSTIGASVSAMLSAKK